MKHKKIVTIGIILLAVSFIVMALSNSTYALFSAESYGTNTNLFTTGMLSIEASSKSENISLDNVLPITDEEGLNTSPYVFTIKNIGNLDYLFDVKLLSIGDSSISISPQYIKLQIDDGDVTTLFNLINSEIKSDITLLAGNSIDISLRIWLSIDTPNTELGKTFNSKIVADGKAVSTSSNNKLNITASKYITGIYNSADKTVVTNNGIEYNQAQSVSLMNDRLGGTTTGYDSGNIRYYGADPNNYIYFNCTDYRNQNDETCEKWRIIGVFDGKLKLIRNEPIGEYAWDLTAYMDDNNWKDATLNTMLNNAYLNSGKTMTYILGSNASVPVSVDFSTNGITKQTRESNLISESIWDINKTSSLIVYSNDIYIDERTGDNTWVGNIGLAYPSDYGYSADLNNCIHNLHNYQIGDCLTSNWLNDVFRADEGMYWLLTADSNEEESVYFIFDGYLNTMHSAALREDPLWFHYVDVTFNNYVVPTLYLEPNVSFNDSGDGSSDNPYQIYVEPVKLIEHIKDVYISGNPTLKTQELTGDSYYFSYQDTGQTWGLMNDGFRVSEDSSVGSEKITDNSKLINAEEGNIRYFGPNPNNWIYFNCTDYHNQNDNTCEKWHIVGIVDGKVKIRRAREIGLLSWDWLPTAIDSNNWKSSTLKSFLNEEYFDRGTYTDYGYCNHDITGEDEFCKEVPLNLEQIGIKSNTRNMISESTWYLGGTTWFEEDCGPADIYRLERMLNSSHSNPYSIDANIGLLYVSDYVFSTDLSKCDKYPVDYSDNLNGFACGDESWIYRVSTGYDESQWFITPNNNTTRMVFSIDSDGGVGTDGISSPKYVNPVVYLETNLMIGSGDGSYANPYKIFIK